MDIDNFVTNLLDKYGTVFVSHKNYKKLSDKLKQRLDKCVGMKKLNRGFVYDENEECIM